MHFIAALFQTFIQTLQLDLRNRSNMFFTQRMEDHHFIDTVDKLRTEALANHAKHQILHMTVVQLAETFLDQIGTEV